MKLTAYSFTSSSVFSVALFCTTALIVINCSSERSLICASSSTNVSSGSPAMSSAFDSVA